MFSAYKHGVAIMFLVKQQAETKRAMNINAKFITAGLDDFWRKRRKTPMAQR